MIDLRSDTVTRPVPAMREAMARAEVGDDVYGEDPTAAALEAEVASLLGKEAALFVPSGTMSNQLAIAILTRPGDEIVAGEGAHLAAYESGATAALSGVQISVAGSGGLFGADDLAARVHPRDAWYSPRTSLVCLENTHNRAGGRVFPLELTAAVTERARSLGLALHLDGARLWNAATRAACTPEALAAPFDTVSVCFSKGLGAPVGSALVGPRALVSEARKLRKRWGGGMRQVGVLAAAARFALAHHRARLAEDHDHARALWERLVERAPRLAREAPETNIVLGTSTRAARLVEVARARGVLIGASGDRLRMVTHLDVTRADALRAADAITEALHAVEAEA